METLTPELSIPQELIDATADAAGLTQAKAKAAALAVFRHLLSFPTTIPGFGAFSMQRHKGRLLNLHPEAGHVIPDRYLFTFKRDPNLVAVPVRDEL